MLVDYFRGLLACESEANRRAIDSLESIPADRRAGPAYERAMRLIPHCQVARRVWLWRLQGTAYESPTEWFPFRSAAEQREECARRDREWGAYLASLTDDDLARGCVYTSSEGVRYASTVRDVLSHVFNHSTYHRGQVARLVTECGGARASTDYIALTRRTL